jgi:UDP:flavonoid glycosyltransferase YjiC (YdhE family)
VFEALMEGKPMVAIPLAHDQPAMAARLARLKIAEVLPVMRLSAKRIRKAVTKLLSDPSYLHAAREMQTKLHSLRGLERAVEVIEKSLERQPSSRCMGIDEEWSSSGDRWERHHAGAPSLAPR